MVAPSAAMRALVGLFRAMKARGEPAEVARRFTLRCAVARFAEDTGFQPSGSSPGASIPSR